jgi:hypothetical protein
MTREMTRKMVLCSFHLFLGGKVDGGPELNESNTDFHVALLSSNHQSCFIWPSRAAGTRLAPIYTVPAEPGVNILPRCDSPIDSSHIARKRSLDKVFIKMHSENDGKKRAIK